MYSKATLVLAFALVASPALAHGHRTHHHRLAHASHARPSGSGIVRVETKAGPIRVAAAYADRFIGFINALVEEGHRPRDIGCASSGHMANSKHHWGGACDVDQRARNKTASYMYHVTELAHKFNLTDGCEWRNADCGHVEVPTSGEHYAHHGRHRHYAGA